MMIPWDYIPVNDSFIEMVRSRIENGILPGVDEEQIAALSAIAEGKDLSQMDMLVDGHLNGNVNIQVQSFGIPGSMLAAVKDQPDEINIASYESIGIERDCITTHDMEQIGDLSWYRLSCSFLGQEIEQYITADEDGLAYLVTFTGVDGANMFGDKKEAKELMEDFIEPAYHGDLTLEKLRTLDIHFGPGSLRCISAEELNE